MILKAKNDNGYYKLAKKIIESINEDGSVSYSESWYTIPISRTIKMCSIDGYDVFRHKPDTKEYYERLKSSDEYIADNDAELMARNLSLARKCVIVGYDDLGIETKSTLDEYITSFKDPKNIKYAIPSGDYYKNV